MRTRFNIYPAGPLRRQDAALWAGHQFKSFECNQPDVLCRQYRRLRKAGVDAHTARFTLVMALCLGNQTATERCNTEWITAFKESHAERDRLQAELVAQLTGRPQVQP